MGLFNPFSLIPRLTALCPSFLSVACPGAWSYDSSALWRASGGSFLPCRCDAPIR